MGCPNIPVSIPAMLIDGFFQFNEHLFIFIRSLFITQEGKEFRGFFTVIGQLLGDHERFTLPSPAEVI